MGEELRDIHLPAAISWWPPAIGWWIVIALSLLAIAALYFAFKYIYRPTMKKQANALLAKIASDYENTNDTARCLKELSELLRRIAITQNPLHAGLTGDAWLDHLDKDLKTPEFSQGAGKIFLSAPYRPIVKDTEVLDAIELCKKWVEAK